jgi:hypothetical protein
MRAGARITFLILLSVWAGVTIGVSLIATPVKFQAHSLTMQAGLEVGRYTFRLLGTIELCFLVAAIIAAGIAQPRRITLVLLAVIVAEILLQRCWLLPVLDNRVSEILAGGPPSFSIHHRLYAILEVLKVTLLIMGTAVEYSRRVPNVFQSSMRELPVK